MKTVAEVIGVSRSNLVERLQQRPPRRRIGRPPLLVEELAAQIKAAIAKIANLRLPARPRHPQAPGAGREFKAA